MKELLTYRELLLERFSQTTEELAELLAALPGNSSGGLQLAGSSWPVEAEAGVSALVEHLCRFEAETFLPRIERMSGAPEIHMSPWSDGNDEAAGDAVTSWTGIGEALLAIRRREADLLQNMEQEAWSRAERHPAWGMRTLQWWVEASLEHSREHLYDLRTGLGLATEFSTGLGLN